MYQQIIREEAARMGYIGANTPHIEAWMRLEYGTLDHLSRADFRREIVIALECMAASTTSESASLAHSYGL